MSWSIVPKLCENLYFALRHYCFHILAYMDCRWLPFIRQAETELKPHKKQLRPQYTWIEQLSCGLLCPLLIFIIPVVLTFSGAFLIDTPFIRIVQLSNPDDSIPILAGYLTTIGAVLAAVTGLLLTVIALTIGVKTSNLGGANFLLNATIRRRGFLPVAAFLLGTVLTSLLGVILSNRLPLVVLVNYTCLTALLSLACLVLLLDLLRRTMQTLGTSDLEGLLTNELLSSLRKSFRNTLRQAIVERRFSETLADLGFARYTATDKEEGHPTEYKLNTLGKIVAIDPAPLKQISSLLKLTPLPRERNTSSVFVYRPDDDAAWITVQPNGNVSKGTQLALLTKEETPNKRITSLIRNAFVIQKPSDSQLPWQRLREVISSAIERYESTTITVVADALTSTFEDYLEAQAAVAGQGKLLLDDFTGDIVYSFKPPHPYTLRLSDLTLYATRSRSQDCLDELLTCIYKLGRISFEKDNEKYFRNWIFEFYRAYHSLRPDEEAPRFTIAPDITRRMHWLSDLICTDIHGHEKSLDRVKKIFPYAASYLSLCLEMLRTSAERSDQSTFAAVVEHITHFLDERQLEDAKSTLNIYRSHQLAGSETSSHSASHENEQEVLRTYDQLYDYKNLVYVLVGGWLMHKVEAKELLAEKADPFLQKLIDAAPDFRALLDLYAMPGMADMTTTHDSALGFDGWDWPASPYPTGRHGTDFERWIKPFYQFLLLKKAEPCSIKLQNVRHTNMATHESLKDFLTAVSDTNYTVPVEYENAPWSLDAAQFAAAKSCIKKLLTSWSSSTAE